MSTPEQVKHLVKVAFAGQSGEFRPCAYYDDSLDCIRVMTRDCSTTETRVNRLLTLLEATYPQRAGRKTVGFTIKGARHLCHTYQLSLATPIKVSVLLDALISACPDAVVEAIVDHVARPLVRDSNVENVEPLGEHELQEA